MAFAILDLHVRLYPPLQMSTPHLVSDPTPFAPGSSASQGKETPAKRVGRDANN